MPIVQSFKNISAEYAANKAERARKNREVLDTKLVRAVVTNNVEEIERLLKKGADIDCRADGYFDSDDLTFNHPELSTSEKHPTMLIIALKTGSFETALFLATAGADGTMSSAQHTVWSPIRALPLDILASDHRESCIREVVRTDNSGKRQRTFEKTRGSRLKDIFTPEQRGELCDALIAAQLARGGNPLDLTSSNGSEEARGHVTLESAINWGHAELISKLANIGVKIRDKDFVDAGAPIYRPQSALSLLIALFPYVKDVNVTDQYRRTAGHNVAQNADIEALIWLQEHGLAKHPIVSTNASTLAHEVVWEPPSWGGDGIAAKKQFLVHLIEYGYDVTYFPNKKGRSRGFGNESPADAAARGGSVPLCLLCLKAGCEARPEQLIDAISANHVGRNSTGELIDMVNYFNERGLLTQDVLRDAFKRIVDNVKVDEKNVLLGDVVRELLNKGLILDDPKDKEIAAHLTARDTRALRGLVNSGPRL